MKNLKTIQIICKVFYILTKIVFILCIVGCAFCALAVVGITTMKDNPDYFVQKFYKFELSVGEPFNAKVSQELKKLGIIRLVLPLACSVVIGIVYAIFGTQLPSSSGFGMTMGFVYLAISLLIDHHLELEQKKDMELVKGEVEFTSEKNDNKESV